MKQNPKKNRTLSGIYLLLLFIGLTYSSIVFSSSTTNQTQSVEYSCLLHHFPSGNTAARCGMQGNECTKLSDCKSCWTSDCDTEIE